MSAHGYQSLLVGTGAHGAELQQLECGSVLAHTFLTVESSALAFHSYQNIDNKEDGRQDYQSYQ